MRWELRCRRFRHWTASILARSPRCRECHGRCTGSEFRLGDYARRLMPHIDPVLGWMAVAAAAMIFAVSRALKFYDLEDFRGAVTNYRLIPEWLATPFAWIAPVLECGAALGLLLSPIRASAALVLIVLLGVFTGAIVINLARRQRLSWWLLLRNGALFALLAIALMPPGARPLDFLDLATAGMAAATVV